MSSPEKPESAPRNELAHESVAVQKIEDALHSFLEAHRLRLLSEAERIAEQQGRPLPNASDVFDADRRILRATESPVEPPVHSSPWIEQFQKAIRKGRSILGPLLVGYAPSFEGRNPELSVVLLTFGAILILVDIFDSNDN